MEPVRTPLLVIDVRPEIVSRVKGAEELFGRTVAGWVNALR
jgi:hypothetical protein